VGRKLAVFLALLFAAATAPAGTITRGTKAAGGTDFSTGVISASEVNTDFNTIYNEFNGNIDTDNIDASAAIPLSKLSLADSITNTHINSGAAIVFSKMDQTAAMLDADIVDDYSTNDAEQMTESDPGTSDALTNATNLEIELKQLRYKIHELTVGANASAVAAAAATATDTSWADGPVRPGNHIYNGGFDVLDDLSISADGNGWTRVLTPTTLAAENLVEAEGFGDGQGINIIDTGAALSGISQTLDGLKASTRYLAIAATRDDVGTCEITTTGADTNQLTVVSDDSGSWQILSGTFETDSTPTNVVLKLLAVASSDDCVFDNVGVYEINADPLPRAGKVHCYDSTTTASDDTFAINTLTDTGLSCAVTVPGPGYIITVRGKIIGDNDAAGSYALEGRLVQDCGAAATVDADVDVANANNNAAVDDIAVLEFFYVNDSPTAGATCTYTMEAAGDDVAFDLNEHDEAASADLLETATTYIDVVMEPSG